MDNLKTSLAAVAAFLAACAVSGTESPAERKDAGGFTFDFNAASKARFKADSGSGNLLDGLDGWKDGYCYMHNKKIASTDPRHKAVRTAVEWKKVGGGLVIVKRPELLSICGNPGIAAGVSGGFTRTVRLPDAAGGTYRVSFGYRMRHDVGSAGWLLLTPIRTKEAAEQNGLDPHAGTAPLVCPMADMWHDDALFMKDIRIGPGFDAAKLVVRIDGVGELNASGFSMTRLSFESPVTVQFSPAGYIDGTFAFSSGQHGLMCLQWRRNDNTAYRRGEIEYELSLPHGYTLVEATMATPNKVTAATTGDGTVYRMKANGYAGGVPGDAFQHQRQALSALVRADEDAPRGVATFAVFCAGRRVSNTARVEVFTIQKIAVPAPKRYCNGLYARGAYCSFKTAEAREGFSDLFTSAGATWLVGVHEPADVYDMWRRKGVRYITPEWFYCANGFRVGDGKGRPDDQKFVTSATGRPDYAYATCPVAVYEEKSYFLEKFVPQLTKYLKGADGLWANWEPYYFAGHGCFCDSCCRAFAKWMKVPYEEMRKDWPQSLKWGEKYGKTVQKFRSWQHGRLVKTIDRHVIAATGGEKSLGFIPGVCYSLMSSAWRPDNLQAEVQAIDYAGALRWIEPWGPYPWWVASTPYVDNPSDLLNYWCAAKDVREQVDKDYPPDARPKLLAFPHGHQLADAICQPEGISMSLDAFFFNRWESSAVYAFPTGYDARWWRAFAEATARAAMYEDAVLDGTRVDEKVSLTPTPDYPAPAQNVNGKVLYRTTQSVPYLQCAAYDHGGRRICAVFNFAHTATARFMLRAGDMPQGRYEVVRNDGKSLKGSRDRHTFTAEELAEKGVSLSVPPLRTWVFELRPL